MSISNLFIPNNNNLFCKDLSISGNENIDGTLNINGNFTVNTDKFIVESATGQTWINKTSSFLPFPDCDNLIIEDNINTGLQIINDSATGTGEVCFGINDGNITGGIMYNHTVGNLTDQLNIVVGGTSAIQMTRGTPNTCSIGNMTLQSHLNSFDIVTELVIGDGVSFANDILLPTSGGIQGRLNYYEEGTFQLDFTGSINFSNVVINFVRIGKIVNLQFPPINIGLTAPGTFITSTGTAQPLMPIRLAPVNTSAMYAVQLYNQGVTQTIPGLLQIFSTGSVNIYFDWNFGNFGPGAGSAGTANSTYVSYITS